MNTPDQTVPEEAMLSLLSGASAELVANPFPLFAHMRSMGAVIPIPFPLCWLYGTSVRKNSPWRMKRMVHSPCRRETTKVQSKSVGAFHALVSLFLFAKEKPVFHILIPITQRIAVCFHVLHDVLFDG